MAPDFPESQPPQHQDRQPGIESQMTPRPIYIRDEYRGSHKLEGKRALITGGDSGIGRSVAVHFAREGADVGIVYLPEEESDAKETAKLVRDEGRDCFLLPTDLAEEENCREVVAKAVAGMGGLDILVNNAAYQQPQDGVEKISREQLEHTFRVNLFAMFALTAAAVDHLKEGSSIINTASVTHYAGSPQLLDYSSTKGAIIAFTRSLSGSLVEKGIRVNAVAPGPIWTPLIPATFPAEKVAKFGQDTPIGRAGQPCEVATSYVFLASDDASYFTGQTLHPNGGEVVNG